MLGSLPLEKYKDGIFPMPSDDVSPEEKAQAKWNLGWMYFITSQYVNDWCGIRFNEVEHINEIREYALGNQSPNKYKNYFLGKEHPGEKRKGWMNVNFNLIFSPAPMLMDKAVSMLEEIEHDIVCEATDEKSGYDRELKKAELWFKKLYKSDLDQISQAMGVKPEEEILPDSKEELDLYASIGGTKLPFEIFMEKCLGHTFNISNDKENKRKILYDLLSIKMSCTLDEVDIFEQKVKEKYIDIADVIIEYNPNTNFENSRYGAYSYYMTMAEIMAETGIEGGKAIYLAQQNAGRYGNPQWTWQFANDRLGKYGFESWRIPVIYGSYKTVNQKYQTKKGDNYYPATWGKRWGESSYKETVVTDYQVVYHAKWVPGTDFIWNYGLMNDIPNGNLPFHVYRMPGKSIIEQLISTFDDIQCINLRYQNDISKSPPRGGWIEQGALENITYGGNKLDSKEALKMFFQSGWGLFNRAAVGGNPNVSTSSPIIPNEGGYGGAIQDAAEALKLAYEKIAMVTGLDPITLANPTNKEAPVGISKMAAASTNIVLKSIYGAYIDIRESFCRNAANRIQIICKYNKDKDKGYYGVIGQAGIEAIATMGEKKAAMLGIHIHAMPTDREKWDVLEAAKVALQVGKNGSPGMSMSMYFFIQRMINMPGGYKYCQAMMANWESKKNEKELQLAQINMQENKRMEVEAQQAKDASTKDVKKFETDEAIRLYLAQAIIDGKVKEQDFKRDLLKFGVQSGIDHGHELQSKMVDQNIQQEIPQ